MQAPPTTLTDRARRWTAQITQRAGMALHRAGIHPDTITIAGLVIVVLAAIPIAQGQHPLGALILILGLPLDALDGAVARARGQTTGFGGVLDSTLDRYADGLVFGALAFYFATRSDWLLFVLTMAALNGSFVVSYVRARAGEAGLSVKIGLFSRLERLIVLLVMLLIPPLLVVGVFVLAVGTNISVLQRLWYTRRHLNN
jgi:CDP-diacylglycerol---glycerol-3-phosphate 3-phosphatidyltransferase